MWLDKCSRKTRSVQKMSSIYSTLEIEDNTLPNLDAKDRAGVHHPLEYKAIVLQHICCFFSPEPSGLSSSWVSRWAVVVLSYKRSKRAEVGGGTRLQEKQAAELKSEKILCDLTGRPVLGILAKIIDATGPHAGKLKKRILRNKTTLGPNFKEVVAYLDEDHLKEMRGESKKKSARRSAGRGDD